MSLAAVREEAARIAQAQFRMRGLQAGALSRGEIWAVGTLCRWAGAGSKTVFLVVDSRPSSPGWSVRLHPVGGSHLRADLWTGIEYLRREERALFEDRDEPGAWRGWCSCGYVTATRRGARGRGVATRELAGHTCSPAL